ncbi:hypothetical protein Tco_0990903 [Tanacetum coccineum]|uniref:Uncharacterized protein n=1 Tax=Tanacetum coccineum TaxID=301880 RepID=A0ABQ5EYQ3_9ASTR
MDESICYRCTLVVQTMRSNKKPCQGDSLNLPDHRIHKDGDGDALFQLMSDSLPMSCKTKDISISFKILDHRKLR